MPQTINYGHSLLLSDDWDLQLDVTGNIATTTGAYAIAQNVANSIRLFTDDAYYEPERGIPHFALDLSRKPALSVIRSRFQQAAEEWDGVAKAQVIDLQIDDNRTLSGDIRLYLNNETTADVAI